MGVEAASEVPVASALLRFFLEDLRSALGTEEVDIVVFRSGERESRASLVQSAVFDRLKANGNTKARSLGRDNGRVHKTGESRICLRVKNTGPSWLGFSFLLEIRFVWRGQHAVRSLTSHAAFVWPRSHTTLLLQLCHPPNSCPDKHALVDYTIIPFTDLQKNCIQVN